MILQLHVPPFSKSISFKMKHTKHYNNKLNIFLSLSFIIIILCINGILCENNNNKENNNNEKKVNPIDINKSTTPDNIIIYDDDEEEEDDDVVDENHPPNVLVSSSISSSSNTGGPNNNNNNIDSNSNSKSKIINSEEESDTNNHNNNHNNNNKILVSESEHSQIVETITYGEEEEISNEDASMIKKKYGPPEVIQIVPPPDLTLRRFNSGDLGNILGRKETETPSSEEPIDQQGQDLYNLAMNLLGPSASRDATSIQVITSVGKSQTVDQAYHYLSQAALRGHRKSMELVAWAQLVGPLPLDIQSAKDKFVKLSNEGYPNSQTAMGFLHTNGLYVKLNSALPLLYYTFGSTGGSAWSQMALGYKYWSGVGVVSNCEKALEQYRSVAATVASEVSAAGTGPAIQRIRLLDEVEGLGTSTGTTLNADILDYYTMLAERGDVQAQVGLGQLHFQGGRGISPDHHLALKYFKRAAENNNPVAMAFLGKMYLEGNDAVEANNETALQWFQQAAEQSSPVGQSGLGLMYLTGRGLPKDFKKAMQYFTLAADQGWVDGQLHLGNMYMSGIGVRRDYTLASKYYNLAAQSGHILAIYNLAQMHATGTGMMRSCTAAVELYKSVAERGRWGLLLSEAHYDHQEKRYSSALIKYLILSELGYEAAQSNAAYLFERGEIGIEIYEAFSLEDNEKHDKEKGYEEEEDKTNEYNNLENSQIILGRALQYWSRSATQGYTHARVRLGDYYYYGWGTSIDYSTAATQYRQASEIQRNPQAMFNLAYMHEQGLGLKQDLHLAKRFYDMAAETSIDATVPVTLALMKLSILTTFQSIISPSTTTTSTTTTSTNDNDNILSILQPIFAFGPNWDLYLLTILVGILGFMIYFRRPPNP